MKKRAAAPVFLAAGILAMMLNLPVLAEDESVWNFDTTNYSLNGYSGAGGDVVIPDTIQGCTVDAVGTGVFNGADNITSITFPETVKQLEQDVGSWCSSLTHVTLPESLLIIGGGCFSSDESLEEITIPSQVCYIGMNAFGFCSNLNTVTFEGSCPEFFGDAFQWMAEDAVIYVPDDQLAEYTEVFSQMIDVPEIQPSGKNAVPTEPVYDTENLIFDAATGTITGYNGYMTRLDIPAIIDGTAVIAIGDGAFQQNRYLCYLTLPEGLVSIGADAFANAVTLQYVSFPSTLEYIGDRAFSGSYRGGKLKLSEGLQSIGSEAFLYTTIKGELVLPEGLKSIGDGAFRNSVWLESLILPSTLETVGAEAFAGSSLSYIYMDGVTPPQIDASAFSECINLADIDLNTKCTKQQMLDLQQIVDDLGLSCRVWRNQNPDVSYCENGEYIQNPNDASQVFLAGYTGEMTHIRPYDDVALEGENYLPVVGLADGAFRGNQTLEYFAVPYSDQFTYIGNEAFADSRIRTVDLFDSVTTIGEGAFRNCTELEELTIPESVTSIGAGAFEGCQGLKKVTILCDASLLPENAFSGCASLTEAVVTKGAIPAGCFAGTALAEVTLGDQITAIGDNAFADTRISSLVIPANAQASAGALTGISTDGIRISADASDEQVAAWNEVLDIPWYECLLRVGEESAFVKMPFEATPEENFEFDATTGTITAYTGDEVNVVIPRSIGGVEVKAIGYNAFDCARDYTDTETDTNQTEWLKLRSVVIPETVTSLEDSVFSYCQQLETVICYGPLESTARGTFFLCRSLKNVIYVNGVRVLDNYLFDSCEALETVWYKGQADRIGESCFVRSGLETLTLRAKKIDTGAFAFCTNLKEVHIRGDVESVSLNIFNNCTSLSDICFEFTNAEVFDDENGFSGECSGNLTMTIPASATEEDVSAFYKMWGPGYFGPLQDQAQIIRADCGVPDPAMPDIEELLAECAAASADTAETEAVEEPVTEAVEETEMEELQPVPVGEAGAPYVGTWYGTKMLLDGDEYDMAEFGMEMILTLNEDGTAVLADSDEEDFTVWAVENGMVVLDTIIGILNEDGQLCLEEEGTQLLFVRDTEEAAAPTEDPETEADALTGYLERKFVCKTADVSGYTMDASALGAEYSVTFHEDGSLDFVMAGAAVPGLSWTGGTVSTDAGEANALVVIYFDGTALNFVCTDAGLDLDFFGSMLMHFEPEE